MLFYALAASLGLYLLFLAALYLFQRDLIYPAPKRVSAIPAGYEKVLLTTADELELTAAWRPAEAGRPTIVFFHGNGDSLPGAAVATQVLADAGYGILLADYRGYAGNPGAPSETGLLEDGRAAMRFLDSRGIKHDRRIIMGASLGGGVAVQMAAEQPCAALVLVSTFTGLPDVAAAKLPWVPVRLLMKDRFDSQGTIPRVYAPVLVLHAANDSLIPIAHGRTLARAAQTGTMREFADGGHALQFTPEAQQAVAAWLDQRLSVMP